MMWVDIKIAHFMACTLFMVFLFIFKQNIVRNLTKWLSKCKGSLLEGKEKTQLYGDDDEKVQN